MNHGLEFTRKLSQYFGMKLNPTQEEVYADFFNRKSIEEGLKICAKCIDSCRFFPRIAEINELFCPEDSKKDRAVELAGLVWQVVTKHGRHAVGEAIKELGEDALLAIRRFGSLDDIFNSTDANRSIIRAQLRDACSSVLSMKEKNAEQRNQLELCQPGGNNENRRIE